VLLGVGQERPDGLGGGVEQPVIRESRSVARRMVAMVAALWPMM
jgi:hypothetical protein